MARIAKVIPNIEWKHLREVLEAYADYFIQAARDNLGKNKSYASGTLGDTMEPVITIGVDYFKVEIRIKDYWEYLEKGTKPHWVPINILKQWVRIKPVLPRVMKMKIKRVWYVNNRVKGAPKDIKREKEVEVKVLPKVEQMPYIVRAVIHKKGTQPHPFFKPALKDTKAYFELALEKAIDEDVAEYIEQKILNGIMYEGLFM